MRHRGMSKLHCVQPSSPVDGVGKRDRRPCISVLLLGFVPVWIPLTLLEILYEFANDDDDDAVGGEGSVLEELAVPSGECLDGESKEYGDDGARECDDVVWHGEVRGWERKDEAFGVDEEAILALAAQAGHWSQDATALLCLHLVQGYL